MVRKILKNNIISLEQNVRRSNCFNKEITGANCGVSCEILFGARENKSK